MNPTHLLTFSVVARFKSITKAAQHLNLGQPAVSGQLKLLQTEVGEPLYEREGHQIKLTAAGEGLLNYTDNLYHDFNQALEYIQRLKQVSVGHLRIGATMTMTSYFLPHHVVQLQTEHPGVKVYMETGNSEEIVKNMHDYDLGFVEGSVEDQSLPPNHQLTPWKTDEIVVILAENNPLCKKYPETVPLTIFAETQVIWRESGSGVQKEVMKALKKAHIDIATDIVVTGVAGVKESVRAGLGIGFATAMAVASESKGLTSRRIESSQGMLWQLNIIAPKPEIQSRVTRAFLQLCFPK